MGPWTDKVARDALRKIFDAAVAAANPLVTLAAHLPEKPKGRCVVVGAGKASALMAAAVEAAWPDVDLSGVVVTRYGHGAPIARIEIIEAAHPVPDTNSEAAAGRILDMVRDLTADDLVLALISGGGSSLLALPAPGLSLADKQSINRALLKSGAPISEMNAVRKHLSAIKGGKLAVAAGPAPVVTLVISDVPGDDLDIIASGPTVPDASMVHDVHRILANRNISLPAAAADYLAKNLETPKPGDFPVDARLIATPMMALEAAAIAARELGLNPLILGDALEGESRDLALTLSGIALSLAKHDQPMRKPAVLLSGGETTVTLGDKPAGRGGRNTEFLLSLALSLGGAAGIWALAGDTDGIDGVEYAAGAVLAPDTLERAYAQGLDPRAILADHDSFSLFDKLSDLVVTGPTLTNVNDIRAILVS